MASQVEDLGQLPDVSVTVRIGDRVRWSFCTGTVERIVGGDTAEIVETATRGRRMLWRVPLAELRRL